jgi:hypothetical protein
MKAGSPVSGAVPGPIETRRASELTPHPKNRDLFGDPKGDPAYPEVRKSIGERGQQEPCIITADSRVLSGAMRSAALVELYGLDAPVQVRVHPGFASSRDEIEYIIEANTKRRQLNLRQIGRAYRMLTQLGEDEGGVKAKRGRPKKDAGKKVGRGDTFPKGTKTRERAAAKLKTGRKTAEAAAIVFETPGVPAEVQDAVDRGDLAPTVAAEAIRRELKHQGGRIVDEARITQAVTAIPQTADAAGRQPAGSAPRADPETGNEIDVADLADRSDDAPISAVGENATEDDFVAAWLLGATSDPSVSTACLQLGLPSPQCGEPARGDLGAAVEAARAAADATLAKAEDNYRRSEEFERNLRQNARAQHARVVREIDRAAAAIARHNDLVSRDDFRTITERETFRCVKDRLMKQFGVARQRLTEQQTPSAE